MAKAAKTDDFDDDLFETRLTTLKDTQEGIQQMSTWCLQHRHNHKKIVACWLNVFKRVRVEHRLVMFYLANDVIQYSKRKRYAFVESWATAIQRATTMVRDEKVKGKILRIFNIWGQREIYSEEYLGDLGGLLNIKPPKKAQASTVEVSDDFQSTTLVGLVRECVELSTETDKSFKKLPKAPNCDIDIIKQQLKDKSHSDDVEREIERYITYIESYNKNLQSEIKSRKTVLSSLDKAIKFYTGQRGEVKVVVSAYKNFGSRIKLVKKKLDEISPNLPSPIPSPDINAPSPEPDAADLQLPDEQSPISLNLFKNNINGYSSYLDGNLPFDINDFKRDDSGGTKTSSQPIEVIGSRSDDESFNSSVDYYKPESISAYSSGSNISIPGLNPMPVPPVQSEYTSLARSAQQYGGAHQTLFGVDDGGYNPHMSGYNANSSYHNNNSRDNSRALLPPPPPMTPMASTHDTAEGGGGGGNGVQSSRVDDDFNSTWDMNMSWTPLDDSNASASSSLYGQQRRSDHGHVVDTPVSPPHFERESHDDTVIEYSEHDDSSSVAAVQDVDHRQLHLPPTFNIADKLGLSKDKTRQLDIDHRNLISLTGSPHANDQNFHTNKSGDVDYRTVGVLGKSIQTIDTIPMPIGSMDPPPLPSVTSPNKKSSSPQKSNASTSPGSLIDDTNGGTRYDPTDMVVDMDMSDEDLDDILREVNEQQHDDQLTNSQASTGSGDKSDPIVAPRPALLETPPEYVPQSIWDPASMAGQMSMTVGYGSGTGDGAQNMDNMVAMDNMHQHQQQQQPQSWNQMNQTPWNGGGGGGGGRGGGMCVPPPPRPPFTPMPFQYPVGGGGDYGGGAGDYGVGAGDYGGGGDDYGGGDYGGAEYGGGGFRGRGRGGAGWNNSPQHFSQFRGRARGGGSPYFNRGGRGSGGGGMRGPYRGKFRGNNSWN